MIATAHRVQNANGDVGINAYLHLHGAERPWPSDPWTLPETDPGVIAMEVLKIPPGGNRVMSYLDVIAPDGANLDDIERVVGDLSLLVVTDDLADPAAAGETHLPLVFRDRSVVLRFSVAPEARAEDRTAELAALFDALHPLMGQRPRPAV